MKNALNRARQLITRGIILLVYGKFFGREFPVLRLAEREREEWKNPLKTLNQRKTQTPLLAAVAAFYYYYNRKRALFGHDKIVPLRRRHRR